MKFKFTLFIAMLVALASNSPAAALPPIGTFRLTVEEIVRTADCRILILSIEARPTAEMMELRSEGRGGGSCILKPAHQDKSREGQVVLAAMRSHASAAVVTTTVLQTGPNGTHSSQGNSYDLPADAKVESVFSLAVTNGLYQLNRPLIIGERNGEPLQLVVGSWNWNQLSERK